MKRCQHQILWTVQAHQHLYYLAYSQPFRYFFLDNEACFTSLWRDYIKGNWQFVYMYIILIIELCYLCSKVIAVLKQLLFYGNSSAQELIGSQISTDQAELLFPKFRKMLEAADLALTRWAAECKRSNQGKSVLITLFVLAFYSSPQSAHVSISVVCGCGLYRVRCLTGVCLQKLTTNTELPPPTALQDGKPPPFMSGTYHG